MALFDVATARVFDKGQLANVTKYPDAAIEAVADEIAGEFRDICGVAFEPTTTTATVDGSGWGPLLLPDPLVTAVAAVDTLVGTTATALTVDELAALEPDGWGVWWRGGYWPRGPRTVRVTYTHGYATPPPEIVRAALILAVNKLVTTNISERTMSYSDQNGQTFRFATPGIGNSYYGLPQVDSVLDRYRKRFRLPGVG